MKNMLILIMSIVITLKFSACGNASDNSIPQNELSKPSVTTQIEIVTDSSVVANRDTTEESIQDENGENSMTDIIISVGDSVFTAKLHDNKTARDFAAKLPMTLNMSELNGNEKYYYLTNRLPSDSKQIGSINTGDLMLYGSDCLVLFYKSFSTSYSYTKLGTIEDTSGLAASLGSGSVEVSFAVSD